MNTPTIIELPSRDATEAARAKFWRKNVARMTRKELSKATGYSVAAIGLFEQGYDRKGNPLGERAWKRYRLVCDGIMARGRALRAWMDAKGYDE